jgi:hypothetical protein
MTQGLASHREDAEQLGRRFAEFRNTHPLRSRLPEELWAAAAKFGAAGWDRSYGACVGCGSAESAEVDGSVRAWRAGQGP